MLAVVTKTQVHHIDLANEGKKVMHMDRKGKLAAGNCQIISYSLEPSQVWCSLVGISTQDKGQTIDGDIQLFNSKLGRHQPLEGHSATFGAARIHNPNYDSTIFSFVEKRRGQGGSKVHFSELFPEKLPKGATKHKKQQVIQYAAETNNDFPVVSHVSKTHGLLYLVTKFGYLYVYEIASGNQIQKSRVSPNSNVFIGTANRATDGLFVINKAGQVISINCNSSSLVPYIMTACSYIANND